MRLPLFLFLIFSSLVSTSAQRTRNIAWFTPSACSTSRINGLALGPVSGCFKEGDYPQTINGLDIEVIGAGLLLPLAGGNGESWDEHPVRPMQTINGLVISPGGFGAFDAIVNGVNLSGISSMTGGTNGITTALLFTTNRYVNGLSIAGISNGADEMNGLQIGVFNNTKSLKGVQIGLFNSAKNMKGVQIGLLNRTGKSAWPFFNIQF